MLLLVRHAETAPNLEGRLLGRSDPPLTARGQRQALAVATELPPAQRVISSPLARARQTAAAFGMDVTVDERWVELHFGELDGQVAADLPSDQRASWERDPDGVLAGGESLTEVGRRVRGACVELAAAAAEQVVVVVTHVYPIKAAVAWALDVPDTIAWRTWVEDGSVTRIDLDGGRPVLRWFNQRAPGRSAVP